jgi:hypothetical protein
VSIRAFRMLCGKRSFGQKTDLLLELAPLDLKILDMRLVLRIGRSNVQVSLG